ncbi:uncharacterized protein CC84DRAFT_1221638 [Paraphaeosphaeria sporulosa]|uniref:Uncharacterized protein n=1 Tax=Paraphaeosphaeria sporulosa TaxID=1460663 RepID=A0A177C0U0_9PLEO|nr:uncharacterized protein CC84DRAFT_1221638 [Paraphaeosphaeria sporulosa]OAG01105.1 hypothetical protein CC84DRAFT_1221638 [Paraphaeosphaeria sporulosa]
MENTSASGSISQSSHGQTEIEFTMSIQNLLNAAYGVPNAQKSTVNTTKKFLYLTCKKTVTSADPVTPTCSTEERFCEACQISVLARNRKKHERSIRHQKCMGAANTRIRLRHCEYCGYGIHAGGWARHLQQAVHLRAVKEESSTTEEGFDPVPTLGMGVASDPEGQRVSPLPFPRSQNGISIARPLSRGRSA